MNLDFLAKLLEEDPQFLAYVLSLQLIVTKGVAKSDSFDRTYGLDYSSLHARIVASANEDSLIKIVIKFSAQELIRHAFELGYIEEALRCQAALREAET
jgi:hypothetical protein